MNTKISRIKIMKPSTPPLVPYFQVLPWAVAVRVSSAIAKETSKRLIMSEENMVADVCAVAVASIEFVRLDCSVVDEGGSGDDKEERRLEVG